MSGLYTLGFNLPNFTPPANNKVTAEYLNDLQCTEIMTKVGNLSLSRFKWSGLPSTCNERALEATLFFYGKALFFNDEDLGYCHTAVELPGPFNIYYESIERYAYSFEYHKKYTIDNSVIISANKLRSPDWLILYNYCPKLTNALRSIDVHTETLKRPFLIACDEQNKKSVQMALKGIKDNEYAIVGRKFSTASQFDVLNFNNNCYIDQMWANVKNYYAQMFDSLGIRNNFTSKRERSIVSEVEGTDNPVRHILESELYMRQQACKEINEMFGLNVTVEANQLEAFEDEWIERELAGMGQNIYENQMEGSED